MDKAASEKVEKLAFVVYIWFIAVYLQTTKWHYVVLRNKEEDQLEHDTVSFPLLSLTSQIASNDVKVVLVVYVSAARNVFEMSSERLEAVAKVITQPLTSDA